MNLIKVWIIQGEYDQVKDSSGQIIKKVQGKNDQVKNGSGLGSKYLLSFIYGHTVLYPMEATFIYH